MRTLLAFLVLVSAALGDVIVDDFDDAFVLTLPDDEDDVVRAVNIGELALYRSFTFSTLAASYRGVLDINTSEPSALVIDAPEAIYRNVYDDARLRLIYSIIGDVASYDAVAIDFNYATADFDFFRMGIQVREPPDSGQDLHGVYIDPPPHSSAPFTLLFPFSELKPLRGTTNPVDLTTVYLLTLDLWFGYQNIPAEPNLNVSIDRIRLVRSVPEPSTVALAAILVCGAFRYRR